MQTLSKIYTTSGTNVNKNEVDKALINSIYQSTSETTIGAVTRLRQPFPTWDEDTLIAIINQGAEGIIEILPQLSKEVRSRIVSKFQPYRETDHDLYVRMPPKSSRRVTVNVTRLGKAKPRL